jgi:hypothetical protein
MIESVHISSFVVYVSIIQLLDQTVNQIALR